MEDDRFKQNKGNRAQGVTLIRVLFGGEPFSKYVSVNVCSKRARSVPTENTVFYYHMQLPKKSRLTLHIVRCMELLTGMVRGVE